jgi:tetratricopeptide (TPR) repeat protein
MDERCLERAVTLMGSVDSVGRRDPEAAERAFREAVSLEEAGRDGDAIEAFGRAIAADGAHGHAHRRKAELHFDLDGDLERIRVHAATAVVLLPEDATAHAAFARYLSEVQDAEGAAIHYRCALGIDPALDAIRIAFASALVSSGDFSGGEAEVRKVLGSSPTLQVRSLLATALEGQGKWVEAAGALEQAAAEVKAKGSAVLLRRAAASYEKGGDPAKASALRTRADSIDPPPKKRDLRPLPEAKPPPG